MIFGGLFLVLGSLIQRRSYGALMTAVLLLALDGLLTLAAAGQSGRSPIGGLLLRIYLVARMARGLGAIRTLREEETPLASVTASTASIRRFSSTTSPAFRMTRAPSARSLPECRRTPSSSGTLATWDRSRPAAPCSRSTPGSPPPESRPATSCPSPWSRAAI